MNFKLRSIFGVGVIALGAFTFSSYSQNLQSVTRHDVAHDALLASQSNIQDQIKLKETQEYMDILLKEEEEPELDIYTEGWESESVNCYKGSNVPGRQAIDVSN